MFPAVESLVGCDLQQHIVRIGYSSFIYSSFLTMTFVVAGCSLLAVASARIARCMQDAVQVTVILTTVTLQYSESWTAACNQV